MQIRSMFQKDIDRPINGVIKVMQTDEENKRQELEEYVITRELRKHFGSFYSHYEQSVGGTTDKMGVWISGFFGSGKSHFLKILSYLLANDVVAGRHAVDYFEEKLAYDPLQYEVMRRVSRVPTETILFNIDAKSPMGKDDSAILRVFAKVFYEHCGFYGDDLKVAEFERFLSRQGWLAAFREAFEEINGQAWESAREAFAFWEEDVVQALLRVTTIGEQAARNWFNGEESAQMSIDRLAREIEEYVKSKPEDFHLVFLVDEIGQYIGDNSGLMLNLQTVVEELGSRCAGKVWVIVTSQEDIDSVTHVKGNDFSKIQGRFNTRLSLSSASVDEVIKRRLLEKTPEAAQLLTLGYRQNASVMRNLFAFSAGTVADLKGYSGEEEFVESYPFVPYQFKLLQSVLMQVRKHGSSGKHLSGGERSMLSAFQEAAQKRQEADEQAFIPFGAFYDTIHTFLDGAIRRVIDRATLAAEKGQGLETQDVDVLKLLFLIRYVDGLAPNLENLSTLSISDIHAEKISMRRALQGSLDRLTHENYVSRSGENYQFLTDEEQDVNREIRDMLVEPSEIAHRIGEIVFGEMYPGRRFRYKNRCDFTYDPMVDEAAFGQPTGGIRLCVSTRASEADPAELDGTLLLQSGANRAAIVLLNASYAYEQELCEAIKTGKYVKKRSMSQLPEVIRRIIQDKQTEAKEREQTAATLLKEAILHGRFYVAGERLTVRCSEVKGALDQAMGSLIEAVYSKLNYVDVPAKDDADLRRILTGPIAQERMEGTGRANDLALREIDQFLDARARQHMPVTMADMQKRYQAVPYGWREIDVAALVAGMIRAQKIQLLVDGATVAPGEARMISCLRKRAETEKAVLRRKISASEQTIKNARQLAGELFEVLDTKREEGELCGQVQALLEGLKKRVDDLLGRYAGTVTYPGRAVLKAGADRIGAVLAKRGDNAAFLEAFCAAENLLDWKQDFEPVEFFFRNQAEIFKSAWDRCEQARREQNYFAEDEEAMRALQAMQEILKNDKPYRRISELPGLEQTLRAAYERVNAARHERVQEVITQARGDLHTLAGDDPLLRGELAKIDERLDKRREEAMSAQSPTMMDALITQILTYKDGECRRLEQLIASRNQPGAATLKIRTLRRYDVLPQKRLASEQEIDEYVNELRARLLRELSGSDAIQLN